MLRQVSKYGDIIEFRNLFLIHLRIRSLS